MKINIKKLDSRAVVPTKAHATDAGMDLTAISVEDTGVITTYHTGLAVEIPEGYVGLLFPRSSVYKTGQSLTNCVGVIDSGYRGEVMAKFRSVCCGGTHYVAGDRVAQLIILPYPEIEFNEVEELNDSDRGEGGYGSSGR